MLMALELLICGSLILLGGCLWYGIERRTDRLIHQERRKTEQYRQAYTDCRMELAMLTHSPAPLPLQLDATDERNLQAYGKTAKKRIG